MGSDGFTLDVSMMYAVHDALRRDLVRIARITARTDDDPRRILHAAVGWEMFTTYLRVHHTSEDDALWPAMRAALAGRPDDIALLDAMEVEHTSIDELLAAIDRSLADREHGPRQLGDLVDALVTTIDRHLRHEEDEGLALIDATLSEGQWQAFGVLHRERIGSGAPRYLPWLLDGIDQDRATTLLTRMPEPLRRAYEDEWRAAYTDLDLWADRRVKP